MMYYDAFRRSDAVAYWLAAPSFCHAIVFCVRRPRLCRSLCGACAQFRAQTNHIQHILYDCNKKFRTLMPIHIRDPVTKLT